MKFNHLMLLLSIALLAASVSTEFRFKSYYSSHMVLQRDEPIVFAGYAAPGKKITVDFHGEVAEAKADAAGKWQIRMAAQSAGGPFVVSATDGEVTKTLDDVMCGDVWFCTGQSNMWWPMSRSGDAEHEIDAANHPNIRLLDIPTYGSEFEIEEPPYVRGWSRCNPLAVRSFSAIAYHFAVTVREKLGDVPIGLVGAAWGGPPISHFLPPPKTPSPAVIAQSMEAFRTAAWGMRLEDDLRNQCRQLFRDDQIVRRFANLDFTSNRCQRISLGTNANMSVILKDFCGIARFRREVMLPDSWAGKELDLELGQSALPAIVFFNGDKIGAVRNWDAPIPGSFENSHLRWKFHIPAQLSKRGKNRIDVILGCNDRLTCWWAFNGTMPLSLAGTSETMALAGNEWLCERIVDIPPVPRTYGNSWGPRISPFFSFPVKGVLFYQGEADAYGKRSTDEYLSDQKRLISLLRNGWKKPDLPFYCMQLASYSDGRDRTGAPVDFCEIREAQRLTAEEIPHSGTACSIDIGEAGNIHPNNKREQGRRMALQALAKTYGCNDVVADGPWFDRLVQEDGNTFVVFKPAASKLVLRGKQLTGFEACDTDGQWHPVKAFIDGNRVRLEAKFPISKVRYLWQSYPVPDPALFNAAGLPAVPFQS